MAETTTTIVKDFVTSEHPIYAKRKTQWEKDERRYRGGRHIHKDLFPFQWEQAGLSGTTAATSSDEYELMIGNLLGLNSDGDHFSNRKEMIRYLNFSKRMATKLVGRLSSEAPQPDKGYYFGMLGTVRKPEDRAGTLSRAEILWHNCDRKGSPLVAWWNEQQRWAMVTGHRWVGVEVPAAVAASEEQERRLAIRPYLVAHSPLACPNWVHEGGLLQALVIKLSTRAISKDGKYSGGEQTTQRLLYVRAGYADLGEDYKKGGWWKFKDDGNPLLVEGTQPMGKLSRTGGEIPYTMLYQEEDDQEVSRSAMETLNNMSVAYLNAASAQTNDVIEGGGRALYLLGVNRQANNVAAEMTKAGARHRPVPGVDGRPNPGIHDTGSVSASGPIKEVLDQIKQEAAFVAMDETQRSPDASGIARQIEFMEVETPVLSMMAFNREGAENECLRWLCQLWRRSTAADQSNTEVAMVTWNKRIDLKMGVGDWLEVFDAVEKANARSATLTAEGVKAILADKGIVVEDEVWTAIAEEIKASIELDVQGAAQDGISVF